MSSKGGRSDEFAPLWKFVDKLGKTGESGGNNQIRCTLCNKVFVGSYFRVKAHLLRLKNGGIGACPKVTSQMIIQFQHEIEAADAERRNVESKVPLPNNSSIGISSGLESGASNKRKLVDNSAIGKLCNASGRENLRSAIARMFYASGLPFHLARSPYYVQSYTLAANTPNIKGFVPPSYNALRATLLQKECAHIERLLLPIKSTWKEKGVTIVSDGWSDAQRRPLLNFLTVTDKKPMFLKARNCEGEYKCKNFFANSLKEIILEVGPQNVVQVITDNAPVCKAAGLLIEAQFPNIFWTPCVVHTLNLALKNICAAKHTETNDIVYEECHWITDVIGEVMGIKNFICTHSMRLAMFNDFVSLKLLSLAETRFASSIVMLKRFKLIKGGLQMMVINEKWAAYREDDVGKAQSVKETILNDVWWDKIDYILNLTLPIYDMLRCLDTDMPALHLVYDMWDTMIEKVKNVIFRHEGLEEDEISNFYDVVHGILVDRWNKSSTPLHCLAHSLTPRYYSEEWLSEAPNRVPPHKDAEISNERNKCFRKYFPDLEVRNMAIVEFSQFSGGTGDFGSFDCLENRSSLDPRAWWINYGASAPMLQNLAIKLLAQPCSSSCSERNWSTYSFIHSMKRNKIMPQRAEDLVFVHSNLRLLSRRDTHYKKGESKMWDVSGDAFGSFDGAGDLEIANLSLDEPDMEAVLFNEYDMGDNDDDITGIEEIE